MSNKSIIGKIKKCLALAKSDNPHEAANALRQAQKLMELHNLSDFDLQVSDVSECKAKASNVDAVPWEATLAHLIAEAFGCDMYASRGYRFTADLKKRRFRNYCFVGVNPASDIAQYAFEVLSGQCSKARRRYIMSQPKNCTAKTKTARGDVFAGGYVSGLRNLVQKFVNPEGAHELIAHYMKQHYPEMAKENVKDRTAGKNYSHRDYQRGREEAKNAKLNHGVAGRQKQFLLD
jgi:hypothetical protein